MYGTSGHLRGTAQECQFFQNHVLQIEQPSVKNAKEEQSPTGNLVKKLIAVVRNNKMLGVYQQGKHR